MAELENKIKKESTYQIVRDGLIFAFLGTGFLLNVNAGLITKRLINQDLSRPAIEREFKNDRTAYGHLYYDITTPGREMTFLLYK